MRLPALCHGQTRLNLIFCLQALGQICLDRACCTLPISHTLNALIEESRGSANRPNDESWQRVKLHGIMTPVNCVATCSPLQEESWKSGSKLILDICCECWRALDNNLRHAQPIKLRAWKEMCLQRTTAHMRPICCTPPSISKRGHTSTLCRHVWKDQFQLPKIVIVLLWVPRSQVHHKLVLQLTWCFLQPSFALERCEK